MNLIRQNPSRTASGAGQRDLNRGSRGHGGLGLDAAQACGCRGGRHTTLTGYRAVRASIMRSSISMRTASSSPSLPRSRSSWCRSN